MHAPKTKLNNDHKIIRVKILQRSDKSTESYVIAKLTAFINFKMFHA